MTTVLDGIIEGVREDLAARIAVTPEWDEDVPMQEKLPFFPGAQMQVVIPERIGDAPVRAAGRSRT